MPFYTFQLEVGSTPEVVAEKIRGVTRDDPGLWAKMWSNPPEEDPNLFWGSIRERSFRLERNIGYRNSFLPRIRGRIDPSGIGSRIHTTMFMHPLVGVFLAFWLTIAADLALHPLLGFRFSLIDSLFAWAMLAFGLPLPLAAFFLESFKARRILESLVIVKGVQSVQ
jgi:hypothetical protein